MSDTDDTLQNEGCGSNEHDEVKPPEGYSLAAGAPKPPPQPRTPTVRWIERAIVKMDEVWALLTSQGDLPANIASEARNRAGEVLVMLKCARDEATSDEECTKRILEAGLTVVRGVQLMRRGVEDD
jgi:hypothetical protein